MANLAKVREALELLERADALLADAGLPDDMCAGADLYAAIESVREDMWLLEAVEAGYPS